MLINRLVTENFGQYARMDYRFGPGVVGIVGPNASGKSTLLEAICATLTGEYAGPKAERIRRGVEKDDPAYVEGHWTVRDSAFVIRRELQGSGVVLRGEGVKEVSGVSAVREKLQDILMLPERVVQDYSFIRQGDLFGFLKRSGTERVKSFQHLCGVAHAEKIRKAIHDEVTAHFSDLGDVDNEAIDSLHRRFVSLEKQLAEAQAELATLEKTAMDAAKLAVHREALKRLTRQQEAEKTLLAAQRQVTEAEQALPEARASLAAFGTDVADEARRKKLLTLTEQVHAARKREKLEAALSEPLPTKPGEDDDWDAQVEAYHKRAYDNAAESSDLVRRLSLLEEGLSECDKCGQPIPAVKKGEAEKLKERQKALATDRADIDKRLARAEKRQAAFRDQQVTYLTAVESRKNLQSELDELPKVTKPLNVLVKRRKLLQDELAAADAQATQRKALQKLCHEIEARLQVRREQLAKAEVEEAAASKRLRVFKKKNKIKAVTATAIEQAELLATAMAECRGRAEVLLASRNETRTELETVTKRLNLEKPRRQYRDRLLGIREACRYNQLPQEVILSTLRRLEGKTNGFLRKIGADFKIEVDDDLVFTSVVGADREKAEYFSFGQKVMTALSFLLACNRVFAGVCDFLALDEPSEYLDKQHVEDFAELLGVLDRRFRRQGRQLLVVTHNRDLLDSLTQVVDLSRSL